jgi:hypothetical protein
MVTAGRSETRWRTTWWQGSEQLLQWSEWRRRWPRDENVLNSSTSSHVSQDGGAHGGNSLKVPEKPRWRSRRLEWPNGSGKPRVGQDGGGGTQENPLTSKDCSPNGKGKSQHLILMNAYALKLSVVVYFFVLYSVQYSQQFSVIASHNFSNAMFLIGKQYSHTRVLSSPVPTPVL